jgi:D-glycero-D-manno-heptose 1,7-bisphosphate phosphatase
MPLSLQIDKNWTLFLDRDGVINRRIFGGYVTHPEEFVFLPGVPENLAVLSRVFGKIIVVTNQQGIGKGLMDEKQLEAVHQKMRKGVEKAGGRIDAVFFCPDLAEKPDNCRKPSPFLALEARKRFPEIDFHKSIMVGDAVSDMVFGKQTGMFTVWVGAEDAPPDVSDFKFTDLPSFALLFKNKTR